MSLVTVYTTPNCGGCGLTKMVLDKEGIDYEVVDLSEDEQALATVKDLGYSQAPVVVAGEDHWSGFQPDLIKALAA